MQAVSKIGAKVGEFALYMLNQTPTETDAVVKNFSINYKTWDEYASDYVTRMEQCYKIEEGIILNRVKDDWNSTRAWSALEPISMLLLSARGEKKGERLF